MPETPWISPYKIVPEPEKDYIVVVTYLPLKSYLSFPSFFKHVQLIQQQLQKTLGVIGFKMKADIFTKKTYTMSVWEDANSLKDFLTSGAHGEIMAETPDYLGADRKFATVFIKGKDFPPSWDWAMKTLKEN